jgi:hypothetical protein
VCPIYLKQCSGPSWLSILTAKKIDSKPLSHSTLSTQKIGNQLCLKCHVNFNKSFCERILSHCSLKYENYVFAVNNIYTLSIHEKLNSQNLWTNLGLKCRRKKKESRTLAIRFNHQRIKHLQQPLDSWGPSNHRSHVGFKGPIVLSKQKKINLVLQKYIKVNVFTTKH